MGAACCCLRMEDFEDYVNRNGSFYRNYVCLDCFLQNFIHVYASFFQRGEMQAIPSSIQGTAALSPTTSNDSSLLDMYCSPPRPLPYDADPSRFRMQRDGLVSRCEKGSSHSHEESEPLRRSDIDADSEALSTVKKWNSAACDDESEEQRKSSVRLSSRKSVTEFAYIYSSSEEEDVCPTCLEEYTPENPKIVTKCSHHFHLGCIYEWMERSENCPVCGKVLAMVGPVAYLLALPPHAKLHPVFRMSLLKWCLDLSSVPSVTLPSWLITWDHNVKPHKHRASQFIKINHQQVP